MSPAHSIALEDGVVVIALGPFPTVDDMISARSAVSALPKKDLRLWDFSLGLDLSSDELQRLSTIGKRTRIPRAKVALVAPADLTFGISRMYEVFTETPKLSVRAFRSKEEALEWLKQESDGA